MAPSDNLLVAAAQSAFLVLLDALNNAVKAGIAVDCDIEQLNKAIAHPDQVPPLPVFTFTKEP